MNVKKTKHEQYVPVLDEMPLPDVRKTNQMAAIEADHDGEDIRLIIKRLYDETGSQKAVAKQLGLEQSTITYWAIRLGITFTQQPVALIRIEG